VGEKRQVPPQGAQPASKHQKMEPVPKVNEDLCPRGIEVAGISRNMVMMRHWLERRGFMNSPTCGGLSTRTTPSQGRTCVCDPNRVAGQPAPCLGEEKLQWGSIVTMCMGCICLVSLHTTSTRR